MYYIHGETNRANKELTKINFDRLVEIAGDRPVKVRGADRKSANVEALKMSLRRRARRGREDRVEFTISDENGYFIAGGELTGTDDDTIFTA